MSEPRPLRIAVVAGEESGDLLGADLVSALAAATGRKVELVGVGGRHLQALGLVSLFEASEIALMGVTAVLRDLPRLMRRIGLVARAVTDARPDCLITIDSPAFGLRVAKKVRAAAPGIPIVHYVCPSVWAWGPSRARAMKGHVDHVLCLLPFEPAELARLDGPKGTFVGHRLTREPGLVAAAAQVRPSPPSEPRRLLVLPGSRRSEVGRLIAPFGETVERLHARGNRFEVTVPTVPHVERTVRDAVAGWSVSPAIVTAPEDRWRAFAAADCALAASGTVTLELALARVPTISCYRTDWMWRAAMGLVTTWSASLPNLVAGWPVVPEYYNEYVRPETLARLIEQLWDDTPLRAAQLSGFELIAERLATGRPAGELAAEAVLAGIGGR